MTGGMRGTEHRSRYQLAAAASNRPSAYARPMDLGPDSTSSSIGLPWTNASFDPSIVWHNTTWKNPAVGADEQFRTTSSEYRPHTVAASKGHPRYEQANTAGNVRYLQAPYLVGAMAEGAGLDSRPTSAVSTYSLASQKQKDMLETGAYGLAERCAQIKYWTHTRSMQSQPISAMDSYLTSSKSSFGSRPAADSQQHRLRKFTTSAQVQGPSLESAPFSVPTTPLSGGSALHATRYLGLQASDGGRRLMEVDTTGAPAAIAQKHPYPGPGPTAPDALTFVASQPITTTQESFSWPIERFPGL